MISNPRVRNLSRLTKSPVNIDTQVQNPQTQYVRIWKIDSKWDIPRYLGDKHDYQVSEHLL